VTERAPQDWERQRTSFGGAAGLYERARPGYPASAVDWLLPPGVRRVVDLAAGTGKLTRRLAERGLEVVAVEPSAGMRAEFARVLPGVPVLEGAAEELPLEDRSVDAVLVGQAWHWVDPGPASREVARVLVPGGRLGLVWNLRDPAAAWVAELERIVAEPGLDHDGDDLPAPEVGPPFGALESTRIRWSTRLTPEGVVDLVASRSWVITMPDLRRRDLFADIRHLLATHPDTAGRDVVELPYIARCYRTVTVPAARPR
jgi:SAM-dependent methyltransferase